MIFQKFVNFVEGLVMSTYQEQGILAPIVVERDQSILKHLELFVGSVSFVHPEKGLWQTPKRKKYWATIGDAKRAWAIHHRYSSKKHWTDEGYILVGTTYTRSISIRHND